MVDDNNKFKNPIRLDPRAEIDHTPMVMTVCKDLLLRLVNEELVRCRQPTLPPDTLITVDDRHGNVMIIEHQIKLDFRWKR